MKTAILHLSKDDICEAIHEAEADFNYEGYPEQTWEEYQQQCEEMSEAYAAGVFD